MTTLAAAVLPCYRDIRDGAGMPSDLDAETRTICRDIMTWRSG